MPGLGLSIGHPTPLFETIRLKGKKITMASLKKASVFLLLLLFVVVVSEEMVAVEGRTCESPSSKFNGICVRSSNCASVCQGEGFSDGECEGLRRRCMCRRPC